MLCWKQIQQVLLSLWQTLCISPDIQTVLPNFYTIIPSIAIASPALKREKTIFYCGIPELGLFYLLQLNVIYEYRIVLLCSYAKIFFNWTFSLNVFKRIQITGKRCNCISILMYLQMPKLSGHLAVGETVGYVAQQAWIFNGTLRENVLFGIHYQGDW